MLKTIHIKEHIKEQKNGITTSIIQNY